MIKRHVIYCDHCLDSVVEAGSNARERKPATVSHEVHLPQTAKQRFDNTLKVSLHLGSSKFRVDVLQGVTESEGIKRHDELRLLLS